MKPLSCISIILLALAVCSCQTMSETRATHHISNKQVVALIAIRDDINAVYGFRDGVPRVNLGPCGRFARDFREAWNSRFRNKVQIAFVMSGDRSMCHHVLVQLPDGDFYDGGNGIVSEGKLVSLWSGSRVDVMSEFDPALLDRRSYGLTRNYPACTNYSDRITAAILHKHLGSIQ